MPEGTDSQVFLADVRRRPVLLEILIFQLVVNAG
jgi:hypothetical protein